jgi:hypothetical protein
MRIHSIASAIANQNPLEQIKYLQVKNLTENFVRYTSSKPNKLQQYAKVNGSQRKSLSTEINVHKENNLRIS